MAAAEPVGDSNKVAPLIFESGEMEEEKEEEKKDTSDGYTDIRFAFDNVNFEMLRRKRSFVSGADTNVTPVMPGPPAPKKKIQYESFNPVGDVIPIVPKAPMESLDDFKNLLNVRVGVQASDSQNA